MRSKGGVFSLITYVIYTLLGVVSTVLINCGLLSQDNVIQNGWFSFVAVLFEAATIGVAVSGIVLVLLKALHLGTRWPIFGVFCVIIDINIIWSFITSLISLETFGTEALVLIPFVLLATGSLVSNFRSFGN
jgi:hypothetical protein